jgi:ABC-type branched-subunit amino acid transport system substrate-binding protein
VVVAVIILLAACTRSGPLRSPSSPTASPTTDTTAEPFVLRVVATLTGPDAEEDVTFVDGIRLGGRVANRVAVLGRQVQVEMADDGGNDDETTRLIREAVRAPGTAAVLLVGPGEAVTGARRAIEFSRTPVFLLGGDLYSTQGLFRQVFQVSIPLRWQAAVLARYLIQDRTHRRVAFATESESLGLYGPGGQIPTPAEDAFGTAMAEEERGYRGVGLTRGFSRGDALRLGTWDAIAYAGSRRTWERLVEALGRHDNAPQVATFAEGLSESAGGTRLLPGTVAPYSYTWAPWAEPIRRVAAFRDLCERVLGHPPQGFEQEGYDAVRLLADALRRSDGRGGDALVAALESFTEARYSSTPIRLGPDDHLFPVDRWVGIFAVERENDGDPWGPSWAAWRPVMRTFTTNGERTIIPDIDRDVFFPGWRPREPAPDFWTARYGITTRRGDPLH